MIVREVPLASSFYKHRMKPSGKLENTNIKYFRSSFFQFTSSSSFGQTNINFPSFACIRTFISYFRHGWWNLQSTLVACFDFNIKMFPMCFKFLKPVSFKDFCEVTKLIHCARMVQLYRVKAVIDSFMVAKWRRKENKIRLWWWFFTFRTMLAWYKQDETRWGNTMNDMRAYNPSWCLPQ